MITFKMRRSFFYLGGSLDKCRFKLPYKGQIEDLGVQRNDLIKWKGVMSGGESKVENRSVEGSVNNEWGLDKNAWKEEKLENIRCSQKVT